MEHKYQWSLFVDPCKSEQFVIRCDDSTEFLEAINLVQDLVRQHQTEEPPEPEIPPDQCQIHNVTMKKRQGKTGTEWYDHRWQDQDVWHTCNGITIRTQAQAQAQ